MKYKEYGPHGYHGASCAIFQQSIAPWDFPQLDEIQMRARRVRFMPLRAFLRIIQSDTLVKRPEIYYFTERLPFFINTRRGSQSMIQTRLLKCSLSTVFSEFTSRQRHTNREFIEPSSKFMVYNEEKIASDPLANLSEQFRSPANRFVLTTSPFD